MDVETQERSGIEIKIALDIYEKHTGQGGEGVRVGDGSSQEESIIFALVHYLSLSVHRQVWGSPGYNLEVSLLTHGSTAYWSL